MVQENPNKKIKIKICTCPNPLTDCISKTKLDDVDCRIDFSLPTPEIIKFDAELGEKTICMKSLICSKK
jgi:hypothetical protein